MQDRLQKALSDVEGVGDTSLIAEGQQALWAPAAPIAAVMSPVLQGP